MTKYIFICAMCGRETEHSYPNFICGRTLKERYINKCFCLCGEMRIVEDQENKGGSMNYNHQEKRSETGMLLRCC
jgi:hypothetical protein